MWRCLTWLGEWVSECEWLLFCYLAIKASLKKNDNSKYVQKGTKGASGGGADRQAAPGDWWRRNGCEERRRRRKDDKARRWSCFKQKQKQVNEVIFSWSRSRLVSSGRAGERMCSRGACVRMSRYGFVSAISFFSFSFLFFYFLLLEYRCCWSRLSGLTPGFPCS